MPVSYHETYEVYKQWIKNNHPKTIIDIGMGYGNIGTMAKQIYSDIELNGVEIFLPYLYSEASQAKNYKRIIIADIKDCIDKLWSVDLIVAYDVIEHLERNDGVKIIEYLKSISNISLLVSLPIVDYGQGPLTIKIKGMSYTNNNESHLTQWKVNEMEALGAKTLMAGQVCGLFEFKK